MVISRPSGLLRTVSGSMVLLQLGSVLQAVAHTATRVHMESWCLGHSRWPSWNLRPMLQLEPYRSERPVLPPGAMVSSKPGLLPRAMSTAML